MRKILLLTSLALSCCSQLFSVEIDPSYPRTNLRDVKIGLLKLIKTIETADITVKRSVYLDQKNQLVYKLWDPTYVYNERFIKALNARYYDELAPLHSIIVQNQKCCGYVTYLGIPLEEIKNGPALLDYKPFSEQSDEFLQFVQLLQETSLQKQLFYVDFTAENCIRYNGNIYLVDLEPVFSLQELKEMANGVKYYLRSPPEYIHFLETLLPPKKKLPIL